MKTLVIHIGWPKTATSTIQDCFFRALHEQGKINYLGKYALRQKGGIYEVWNPWVDFVSHCVYGKEISSEEVADLCEKLREGTSVLSNEDFPISFFGIKDRKFLPETDPIMVPSRIKALVHALGVHDVKIIAVIRNQPDAIYSTYVEGWRWYFRHEPSLAAFRDYLYEGISKGFYGVFRMFFYAEILMEYQKMFGEGNIRVLFFEDIKNDRRAFCRQFASFIGLEHADILEKVLSSEKRNVKRKDSRGRYLTDSPTLYEELWVRWKVFVPDSIHRVIKRSPLPRVARSALGRLRAGRGVCIEPLTEEERSKIASLFGDSNRKLSKFVSPEKLIRYGYVESA